ncbi:unnamed protein product, partial [Polarella glacialis]
MAAPMAVVRSASAPRSRGPGGFGVATVAVAAPQAVHPSLMPFPSFAMGGPHVGVFGSARDFLGHVDNTRAGSYAPPPLRSPSASANLRVEAVGASGCRSCGGSGPTLSVARSPSAAAAWGREASCSRQPIASAGHTQQQFTPR